MNFFLSAHPMLWLALPILMLPIWWHRQKRQRTRAKALATARFLPAAEPQQKRIWQWVERLLLVLRCAMLIALIALLADIVSPNRGDTVLIAEGLDQTWVAQQIQQAHLQQAQQVKFCASASCAPIQLAKHQSILSWLSLHEEQWSKPARILILAQDIHVNMPAQQTPFAHQVELRLQPTTKMPESVDHHITVVSERAERWRALFKSYESAGVGNARYIIATHPNAKTELIIWESAAAPDASWRATNWWLSDGKAFPGVKIDTEYGSASYADSAVGRLYLSDWHINEESDARNLYSLWQKMQPAPEPFLAYSQIFPVIEIKARDVLGGQWTSAIGWLLALLFSIERILSHARRVR